MRDVILWPEKGAAGLRLDVGSISRSQNGTLGESWVEERGGQIGRCKAGREFFLSGEFYFAQWVNAVFEK